MPEISIIDAETGAILQTCDVPAGDVALQNLTPVPNGTGGFDIVAVNSRILIDGKFDARTQYWRNNKVIARPRLIEVTELHLTVEEAFGVKRVPRGTEVTMIADSVQVFTVDDGKIEIMSRQPVSFGLLIAPPFPWQRQQIAVTVA